MVQSKDVGAQEPAESPALPLQDVTGCGSGVSAVPGAGLGCREGCQGGQSLGDAGVG